MAKRKAKRDLSNQLSTITNFAKSCQASDNEHDHENLSGRVTKLGQELKGDGSALFMLAKMRHTGNKLREVDELTREWRELPGDQKAYFAFKTKEFQEGNSDAVLEIVDTFCNKKQARKARQVLRAIRAKGAGDEEGPQVKRKTSGLDLSFPQDGFQVPQAICEPPNVDLSVLQGGGHIPLDRLLEELQHRVNIASYYLVINPKVKREIDATPEPQERLERLAVAIRARLGKTGMVLLAIRKTRNHVGEPEENKPAFQLWMTKLWAGKAIEEKKLYRDTTARIRNSGFQEFVKIMAVIVGMLPAASADGPDTLNQDTNGDDTMSGTVMNASRPSPNADLVFSQYDHRHPRFNRMRLEAAAINPTKVQLMYLARYFQSPVDHLFEFHMYPLVRSHLNASASRINRIQHMVEDIWHRLPAWEIQKWSVGREKLQEQCGKGDPAAIQKLALAGTQSQFDDFHGLAERELSDFLGSEDGTTKLSANIATNADTSVAAILTPPGPQPRQGLSTFTFSMRTALLESEED